MEVGVHQVASLRLESDGVCRLGPVSSLVESPLSHILNQHFLDITEFVIVLNNEDAVKAFSQGGNVTIGGKYPLQGRLV